MRCCSSVGLFHVAISICNADPDAESEAGASPRAHNGYSPHKAYTPHKDAPQPACTHRHTPSQPVRLQPAAEHAAQPTPKPWHRHKHSPRLAVQEAEGLSSSAGRPWQRHKLRPRVAIQEHAEPSSSAGSSRSCSTSSPRSVLPVGHQRFSGHASLTSLLTRPPPKPPIIDRVARYQCALALHPHACIWPRRALTCGLTRMHLHACAYARSQTHARTHIARTPSIPCPHMRMDACSLSMQAR